VDKTKKQGAIQWNEPITEEKGQQKFFSLDMKVFRGPAIGKK
jgi:hypothetical protein